MSGTKVCVLTSVHSAFDTRIFYRECKTLASAGYEVVLVVPHGKDELVDGVLIKAVAKNEKTSRLIRMTQTVWQVYQEAVRQDADLYHFHDPELMPVGLYLRVRGKKVIYDVHENIPHQILHKDWLPVSVRKGIAHLVGWGERFAGRRFSAVITADLEVAQRFRHINSQVVPLQNYPILDAFLDNMHSDETRYASRTVASFGGILAGRAIRELIHAMDLLPTQLNAKLMLGGGAQSEALQQEVCGMPGWKYVDYYGKIPWHEMVTVLGQAAVGIVLYAPHPNHLEVRSNRLFESMAAGLPVIVSHFPKWREVVEKHGCGLAVDPENPQAIAEAITYLISHPNEAAAMGSRARQAALEEFNWAREQTKLLNLYEKLFEADSSRDTTGRK